MTGHGPFLALGYDGAVLALLLAAHVLGDFVFQTGSIVRRKIRAPWMALHAGILGAATVLALVLVVAPEPRVLGVVLALSGVHAAIDRLKLALDARTPRPIGHFLLDQGMHSVSLILAWRAILAVAPAQALDPQLIERVTRVALIVAAYGFNVTGAAVLVGGILHRHRLELTGTGEAAGASSLSSRGRTIGILERMLLLTLVLVDQWGAMGLILAAKSIARFKDLDRREFSEYYLIGTLASVGFAMASGLILRLMI
jgi:hypothetical protein